MEPELLKKSKVETTEEVETDDIGPLLSQKP